MGYCAGHGCGGEWVVADEVCASEELGCLLGFVVEERLSFLCLNTMSTKHVFPTWDSPKMTMFRLVGWFERGMMGVRRKEREWRFEVWLVGVMIKV
jgi:hypothetical protein